MADLNIVSVQRVLNQIPSAIEGKLDKLEDGQVRKLRINPNRFNPVNMQRMEDDKTVFSGKVMKIGRLGLSPQKWNITYDNKPHRMAFFDGYRDDEQKNLRLLNYKFSDKGEIVLRGDLEVDKMVYQLAQIHPLVRYNKLVALKEGKPQQTKNWLFEIVDQEVEVATKMDDYARRHAIEGRVLSLTDAQLSQLMGGNVYGYSFYNRPDLIDKPKLAKDYIWTKMGEKSASDARVNIGMSKVESILDNLSHVTNIGLATIAFDKSIWVVVDDKSVNIKKDGSIVSTLHSPLEGTTASDKAENWYKQYGGTGEAQRALLLLREKAQASKSTAETV